MSDTLMQFSADPTWRDQVSSDVRQCQLCQFSAPAVARAKDEPVWRIGASLHIDRVPEPPIEGQRAQGGPRLEIFASVLTNPPGDSREIERTTAEDQKWVVLGAFRVTTDTNEHQNFLFVH